MSTGETDLDRLIAGMQPVLRPGVYVFNRGDGRDTIEDDGYKDADVIELRGYSMSEVSVGRDGDALLLAFAGADDAIRVENTLDGDRRDQIEEIAFESGAKWSISTIADRFEGLETSVTHAGTSGDDALVGTTGSDVFFGGAGADVFEFKQASSEDRITDFENGVDKIRFAHSDLGFADIAISQDNEDALIDFAGDVVRLVGRDASILEASDFLFAGS
ncbi:MAG: ACT domain-containing protein [Pseudomonadota bacterium]